MARTRGRFAFLLGAVACLGCGDNPAAPRATAGTYPLYSVNGAALPADLSLGSCPARVYGGSLIIEPDSQLTISLDVDPLCDTDSIPAPRVVVSAAGSYAWGAGVLLFPTSFGGIAGVFIVEPAEDHVTVRMGADLQGFWHDPTFRFGPRGP